MSIEHAPGRGGKSARLVTRKEVLKRFGIANSTLYRMINTGRFPKPLYLSPNNIRWTEEQLDQVVYQLELALAEPQQPASPPPAHRRGRAAPVRG